MSSDLFLNLKIGDVGNTQEMKERGKGDVVRKRLSTEQSPNWVGEPVWRVSYRNGLGMAGS